jgi:hypothetical protein
MQSRERPLQRKPSRIKVKPRHRLAGLDHDFMPVGAPPTLTEVTDGGWRDALSPCRYRPLLATLTRLNGFRAGMRGQRRCDHCRSRQNGCQLAGGQMPPEQVQKAGCQSWMWAGIPF